MIIPPMIDSFCFGAFQAFIPPENGTSPIGAAEKKALWRGEQLIGDLVEGHHDA
jgi:hypothetical protein